MMSGLRVISTCARGSGLGTELQEDKMADCVVRRVNGGNRCLLILFSRFRDKENAIADIKHSGMLQATKVLKRSVDVNYFSLHT